MGLSNTNSDKTRNSLSWERTISVNEEGGWKDGSLENIANRILSSVADSLVKHRRSLCINNSFTEDNFSAPISIIGRKYSCGNDDEVFDNVSKLSSQSNDSSFRGRYLTAAESVSELNDDFVDNHQVVSIEKYVISLPDGVEDKQIIPPCVGTCTGDLGQRLLCDYGDEVEIYMRSFESRFLNSPDYLEDSEINHTMRSVLVDWLAQVQHHLKLAQETLYHAIGLLDHILKIRDVDPDKLQLVGVTTLLIASKLEEYYPIQIRKLLHLTDDSYDVQEVLEMELVILRALDFQLYYPSPQAFLHRYVSVSLHSTDPTFVETCFFLIDSHLPNSFHSCVPSSLLAASAIFTASLLYFITSCSSAPALEDMWTSALRFHTKYEPQHLFSVSIVMLDMMMSSKYEAAVMKYRSVSQHGSVALEDHLKRNVLSTAKRILIEWSVV